MNFRTNDIALVAFLKAKDFQIIGTENSGRFTSFIFPQKAEELADLWSLYPDEEMKLVQRYTQEKEALFRVIKQSRSEYGTTNK